MSETRSVPKGRRRRGEKAEERPRKFCDGARERGWKSSVQAGPCLPWASSRGWGPLASWKKLGGGGRGAAKRASSPESQHRHAGLVTGSPAAGRRSSSRSLRPGARERPRQPSRRPSPHPGPGHSRFCSAKGRCDVVKARKDSFPMSQSSNPGTWPWRLAQKSTCCSFRSTVRKRRASRHRVRESGETEAAAWEARP